MDAFKIGSMVLGLASAVTGVATVQVATTNPVEPVPLVKQYATLEDEPILLPPKRNGGEDEAQPLNQKFGW